MTIPKAKKTLHACEHFLNQLKRPQHTEEYEINLSAFIAFARSVTQALQKEFKHHPEFEAWYEKKQTEMNNDPLCKRFNTLRVKVLKKEGIDLLEGFKTNIISLNNTEDLVQVENAQLRIIPRGVYWLVNDGTPEIDLIPAQLKPNTNAKIVTYFALRMPSSHLGQEIKEKSILNYCNLYYIYLKKLVDEWTGIINSQNKK